MTEPTPQSEPEHIEISFDEPEAPIAEAPLPIADGAALVVDLDLDDEPVGAPGALSVDLDDESLPGLPPARADFSLSPDDLNAPTMLPGFKSPPTGEVITKKGMPLQAADEAISHRYIILMGVTGLVGGFLGWVFTEPIQNFFTGYGLKALVIQMMVFSGLVGIALGGALGATPGLSVGVLNRAWRGWWVGAFFGLLGGALGGSLAQYVYGVITFEYALSFLGQLILRAVGWSLLGLFLGLGQAALISDAKKMRNGLLGGAIGGFVGGIALQLIKTGMGDAWLGRCLALCVMGATIGTLIGLIEEAAKEAWLSVVGGPLTGKQFILYEERTVIGSNPQCAIILFKDPSVAPEHLAITRQGGEYVLAQLTPGAATLVNNRPTQRHLLEDGDQIDIGATRMAFCARTKTGKEKGSK